MEKDFDGWNSLKKNINSRQMRVFYSVRDVWWASLGINIGSEEDGKNELFERPVLLIKIFNDHMIRVVPLTSKLRDDNNYVLFECEGLIGSAILSQLKTISPKRLTRRFGRLGIVDFSTIIKRLRKNLL
jgi:mRNA-degrading endonuclease toxin of MazEF toxin-antitoxin module